MLEFTSQLFSSERWKHPSCQWKQFTKL